ncbi:MAG TPA: hypothetical protein EYP11_00090 [Aquificaceae bacterium]|nr:hypothetical protein [Aquificaceae bacterium]
MIPYKSLFCGSALPQGGRKSSSLPFLLLRETRVVKRPQKEFFKAHKGYRGQPVYVVLLTDDKGTPIDVRIVKTRGTLNRLAKDYKVLIHPLPVKIPVGFWEEWKKAKTPQERLKLVKEKGLLKEENIFALTRLVLDVDTKYEEAEKEVLKLFQLLGIKGYELGRTKSGNLRAVIYLKPLRIKKDGIREFYLSPKGRGKNGKTHYENAKEITEIMISYLRSKGLKADRTFTRLNHPIWYGMHFYTRVVKVEGESWLYDIYGKAKELQKEELRKASKKPKGRVIIPRFIAKHQTQALDDLLKWKIATKRLAEKHISHRFTRVIMPAIGWAKYLGLERYEVESFLKELLPDKADMDKELERAWKYGDALEFKWKGRDYSVEELLKRFYTMLLRAEEGVSRQVILAEVFRGQNWLLQMIERFLLREGYISMEKRKLTPGPGRRSYVYTLTEKGKSFIKCLKDNDSKQVSKQVVGLSLTEEKKQYTTPPKEEQRSGLVGGWLKVASGRGSRQGSEVEGQGSQNINKGENFSVLKPTVSGGAGARAEPVRSTVKIQFHLFYGMDIVRIEKPSNRGCVRRTRPLKGQYALFGFPSYEEEEEERTIDTYTILKAVKEIRNPEPPYEPDDDDELLPF